MKIPLVLTFGVSVALAGSLSAQTAVVQGSVTDATSRRRVEGATIRLTDDLSGVTNSRGHFQIKGVAPDSYQVRVTRIGYRAKVFDLPIARGDAGDDIYIDISLEPLPVELEPVVVRGDTSTIVAYGRLADFYRRRRMGMGGRFFTRNEIDRWNPYRVTDLLRMVPGAWVTSNRWGDFFVTFRGRRCLPAVWLDAVPLPPAFGSIDDWVTPERVEAIEVYTSDVTMPLELWGRGWGSCGAIVIWTR